MTDEKRVFFSPLDFTGGISLFSFLIFSVP